MYLLDPHFSLRAFHAFEILMFMSSLLNMRPRSVLPSQRTLLYFERCMELDVCGFGRNHQKLSPIKLAHRLMNCHFPPVQLIAEFDTTDFKDVDWYRGIAEI